MSLNHRFVSFDWRDFESLPDHIEIISNHAGGHGFFSIYSVLSNSLRGLGLSSCYLRRVQGLSLSLAQHSLVTFNSHEILIPLTSHIISNCICALQLALFNFLFYILTN